MGRESGQRRASRLLLVAVVVALTHLWYGSRLLPNPLPCLTSSIFLLMVAPGFIPGLRIGRELNLGLLEMLPLALCLSIGQVAVLMCLFDILSVSVLHVRWILPLLVVGWVVWSERATWPPPRPHGSLNPSLSRFSHRSRLFSQCALLLLTVAVFALVLAAETPMRWDMDSLAHIYTARGVIEEGRVFPIQQPYGQNGVGSPDPRFGVFHAIYALLAVSSGLEIETVWVLLPPFVASFLTLAFFFAARSITGSEWTAAIATLLFPICYGGVGGQTLLIAGYPSRMAMLAYFVSLGVFFRYFKSSARWFLPVLGVIAATMAAIHAYYFMEFCFVLGCFLVAKLIVERGTRLQALSRWTKGIGVVLAFSVPILLYRFVTSFSMANPYAAEEQWALYITKGFYILNPVTAFGWLGFVGTVSILLLPYFVVRARHLDSHAFIASATGGSLLVIFNPFVLPLAGRVLGYLAWRLLWAVPYVLAAGIFLSESYRNIVSGSLRIRLTHVALVALVGWAILATVCVRVEFYSDAIRSRGRQFPENMASISGTLKGLDANLAGRRVFLSDPITAYAIPAFTRHFVTAIPVAHAAPSDSFPVSRVRDAVDVLNPDVGLARTLAILRRYSVEFLIVNTAFPRTLRAFEYEVDPEFQRRALKKISSYPAFFEEVFSENGIHVFRVVRLDSTKYVHEPTNEASLEHADDTASKTLAEFSGFFTLRSAQITPDFVQAGDSVRVQLVWKCMLRPPREDVYRIFIRFETKSPEGPLFVKWLEKPYRKLLERRLGKRFRFRYDIDPHRLERPLHLWQQGELVRQEFLLLVPEDVSPGEYSVQVSLRRVTVATNMHFRDYLFDNDYYSGVSVGTVNIGTRRDAGLPIGPLIGQKSDGLHENRLCRGVVPHRG